MEALASLSFNKYMLYYNDQNYKFYGKTPHFDAMLCFMIYVTLLDFVFILDIQCFTRRMQYPCVIDLKASS